MILSVTMNPSVDMSYPLEEFHLDTTNRIDSEKVRKTAGGKGLNVSRVLHLLEADVCSTGIIGGQLGGYIQKELDKDKMNHHFLEIDQESRNCLAILHNGKQTEILESGPVIDQQTQADFLELFQNLLQKADILTISGSLPKGIPASFYSQLIELAASKQIPTILDCSGQALKESLSGKIKPTVIKPNHHELGALIGEELAENNEDIYQALQHPIFNGVELILVSMGAKGAFVKSKNDYYSLTIPKINVVNPVGSGDSTVAGIAYGLENKMALTDVLKSAMTTGMLNTMEEQTGFIRKENFDYYFNQVSIQTYEREASL